MSANHTARGQQQGTGRGVQLRRGGDSGVEVEKEEDREEEEE